MAHITAIAYERGSGRILHTHQIFSERELSDSARERYEAIVRKDAAARTGADESAVIVRFGKYDPEHTVVSAEDASRGQASATLDRRAKKPQSVVGFVPCKRS